MRGRTTSLAALLAAFVLAALAAIALPADGAADPTLLGQLRQDKRAIADRSASALLELYSLETRAAAARAELVRAERRRATVERERARVRARVDIADRSLAFAERRLAARLRALYEQGDVHPLAILLGADSIDQAMEGLDGLGFAARQDRTIVSQTTAARKSLRKHSRALAARSAELARVEAAAAQRAETLERARAERQAYLAALARERNLKASRIAALEAQARAAQQKGATLVSGTPSASVSTTSNPAPVSTAPGTSLTVEATGYALPGRTATGIPVAWGVVAVDPSVIPLGTRMSIPGYGEGIAADTGSAVRGNIIDLWFPSTSQALQWGRRTVTITLH